MKKLLVIAAVGALAACSTDPTPVEKNSTTPDTGADVAATADAGGMEDSASGAEDMPATNTDTGNPDMGGGVDMDTPDCTDGETRNIDCGLNDRGTEVETCTGGMWTASGVCDDPDECVDGMTQDVDCGRNDRGTLSQTCTTGAWVDDGACVDPDACIDGETRTVACGANDSGTQEQTCVAGAWDTSAMCMGEDACMNGDTRMISCGLNDRGNLDQTCTNGTWADDAACVDPDVCVDSSTQDVSCGLNDRGTQAQVCTAGAWQDSGGCNDPDVCTDGATQNVACGLNNNGTQAQDCTNGAWVDDGACNDPDECTIGDMQSIACGFDGTQDQNCPSGTWVDDGACQEHVVSYCQTRPATVSVLTGVETSTIEGVVFVDPKTAGAGAATGVTGELVWGPAGSDPATWTNSETATYSGDEDGLNAGDLANDVWGTTVTPTTAGDYDYAFRFTADGGATWQLCDTVGTVDGAFDSGSVGRLEVTDPNAPDTCRLQFPHLEEAAVVGDAITVYGRVTEPGIAGTGSANADILAELWVGPEGDDPETQPGGFQVIDATYNATALNLAADQDEYEATFTPTTAGAYGIAYRISVDGGATWEFCGLEDAAEPDGFQQIKMGWVNVWDAAPDLIDFCHVWDDTLSDDADGANLPTVTMEVFEAGVTDQAGAPDGALLEVEAGAVWLEENPETTNVNWNALTLKGRRPGVFNNYEYEGSPYDAGSNPAAGEYNVVVRVRKAGGTEWTYCDTDDTTQDFLLGSTTRLTVTP